jgi:hypothetical protein
VSPIFVISILSGIEPNVPVLTQCLRQIRAHYKTAPLVLISDGDRNIEYMDLAAGFRARLVNGTALNVAMFGGAHLYRTYAEGLKEAGDLIIRMDPAAYLWRPFTDVPSGEYAGYVNVDDSTLSIHSGCSSLSVNAARTTLDDFKNVRYQSAAAFMYGPKRLPSCEAITADVMTRRGILLTPWKEICPFPLRSAAVFAVTHGYSKPLSS